jgi:hypothetical protein
MQVIFPLLPCDATRFSMMANITATLCTYPNAEP